MRDATTLVSRWLALIPELSTRAARVNELLEILDGLGYYRPTPCTQSRTVTSCAPFKTPEGLYLRLGDKLRVSADPVLRRIGLTC